ncbi:hypothetical protein SAMN02745753_02219 [Marinomonas polaris DSM 16579]|uniref:Uncharacterized protein n=1 Tax=Marinomonas polaris DSM 16579 TaxID=1122206 RepID=A0A1M5CRA3_9GAMM|nr:hypothetical protein SAMN02745753_02219 [Marinomonas polaris DSM 16579]
MKSNLIELILDSLYEVDPSGITRIVRLMLQLFRYYKTFHLNYLIPFDIKIINSIKLLVVYSIKQL